MAVKDFLLIGPLPPGWGGARVSFKLFHEYLQRFSDQPFRHYDLPVRHNRDQNPPGRVNHLKTFLIILLCSFRIPFSTKTIVFGSRNFCLSHGLLLLLISAIFSKPCYVRFFGGHPAHSALLGAPFVGSIVAKVLSLSEKIIVQTNVGAAEFPDSLRPKVLVIGGYRPMAECMPDRSASQGQIVRFAYAGAISKSKGIHHLFYAFEKCCQKHSEQKGIELHLYGSVEAEFFQEFPLLPNMFYHGRVDNFVVRRDLGKYDIFVFPTEYVNEGHPGAVIEALMAGLPVIASDSSGVNEVIHNNYNGLLFRPGDVQQLSDTMERLVKDFDLRGLLAANAWESSREFDAAQVIPRLAELFKIKTSDGKA